MGALPVGREMILPTDWDPSPPPGGQGPSKIKIDSIKKGDSPDAAVALNFFAVSGSKRLTRLGSNRGRTCDLYHVKVAL